MKIDRANLASAIEEGMAQGFDYLVKITAVDNIASLQVLYFVRNIAQNKDELLEVDIPYSDAWVPTVTKYYAAADWYEREMAEMFGVDIRGRHVRRLLLEKWDGVEAPLRKSFGWGSPTYKSEE